MAAMRVNIPTEFVSGGPMAAGIAAQKAAHDDLAVTIGVCAAGGVVDVQGREVQPQAEPRIHDGQQGEKRHRVGAARRARSDRYPRL